MIEDLSGNKSTFIDSKLFRPLIDPEYWKALWSWEVTDKRMGSKT